MVPGARTGTNRTKWERWSYLATMTYKYTISLYICTIHTICKLYRWFINITKIYLWTTTVYVFICLIRLNWWICAAACIAPMCVAAGALGSLGSISWGDQHLWVRRLWRSSWAWNSGTSASRTRGGIETQAPKVIAVVDSSVVGKPLVWRLFSHAPVDHSSKSCRTNQWMLWIGVFRAKQPMNRWKWIPWFPPMEILSAGEAAWEPK